MNAANATNASDTIVKEITIDAPAAKIFAALTEPEQLPQWWGEEGKYQVERMEADLRVGGRWRTTGIASDGRQFVVEGAYREIDPPRALAYTWAHNWGDGERAETLVRFDLSERNGSTLVKVTHSGFADAQSRDDHDRGWAIVLGWLNGFVTKKV
ncbi:MAG TPA: SRPBCC domain-containing protein [Candidatus Cybelea sp.]|jgi:uncharacterized protein YndB with AHSA1/START domain|nr:SRPBCC domain-containing protein [Candidatus Cybelea sp.]